MLRWDGDTLVGVPETSMKEANLGDASERVVHEPQEAFTQA